MPEDYRNIQEGLTAYVNIGTAIFLLLAILFILLVVISLRRRKKMLKEKDMLRMRYEKEILQSQLEIQEQTFKNISQEIHDNIGQALTLAKLNLNTMPPTDTDVQEKMTTTKELVSKAIVDLRDLSRSLNTDYVADMGLQKAIEYEFMLISKSSNMITNLQIEGESFRMDKQKELILFRIIQEVLNNILKHAGATTIVATLNYRSTLLEITVTDNGKGFLLPDTHNANTPGTGLGLRNMDNRAKLIGATFSMNSTPGNGTEVRIILPQIPDENGNRPSTKTVF
jgi:signal transduction histidine kinase